MSTSGDEVLLDSDIVSAMLKSHPEALRRAAEYRLISPLFTISAMTRFEILRGLRAIGASAQERAFERFALAARVLPISDAVFDEAVGLYALLHRQGRLIPDADILIASTALVFGLTVATNNEAHFSRVPGLQIDNWLKAP